MLIRLSEEKLTENPYFNTSHVNVNRNIMLLLLRKPLNFNTSHVNVNQSCYLYQSLWNRISIHLMLMLICLQVFLTLLCMDFNTSHVNVNHIWRFVVQRSSDDFNTSHVNVNPTYTCMWKVEIEYFNTSHVNVNQSMIELGKQLFGFQYISC